MLQNGVVHDNVCDYIGERMKLEGETGKGVNLGAGMTLCESKKPVCHAVYKWFFGFRKIKSANVRRCAHVLVFTTSRSNESLKNQLQFAGLPKSHADRLHEEDALEDSTITQHCGQEFLVTLSRRSSQHHVGCKLLAAENPHSVRYRTARRTRPWNLSSKTRATEGCMRPQHLMSARSS